jgi:hypothetical protein
MRDVIQGLRVCLLCSSVLPGAPDLCVFLPMGLIAGASAQIII